GKLMYGYAWPRNTHHGIEEIQAAAQVMYYGGDAAEALLALAFFILWYRSQREIATPRYRKDDPAALF
ncbi:MAG TPA: hypothetical protein VLO12_11255, partial [Halomonas sp.]|nr:hypothetical protein [Halomonas sp.]